MDLGQKVKFKKYLKKENKTWVEKELEETKIGIIAGQRTLQQGYLEKNREGFQEYSQWIPTDYIPVYLIACNLRGFYRVKEEWIEEKETFYCNICHLPLTLFPSSNKETCGASNCEGELRKKENLDENEKEKSFREKIFEELEEE